MLTTKFRHPDGSLWLPSELAAELLRRGHSVTVLNVEWSGLPVDQGSGKFLDRNFRIFNYSAIRFRSPRLSLALRWMFSAFKLWPFLLRSLVAGRRYDLLISFSPCTSLHVAIPMAMLISRESCLVYWDFFPVHNQEISGKAPRSFLPVLKAIEKRLVHSFHRVGCMSPKNVQFYERYFGVSRRQTVGIIPVWTSLLDAHRGDRSLVHEGLGIDAGSTVLVFGGQLVDGRGVVELCEAVLRAHQDSPNLVLIVCGQGPLAGRVIEYQNRSPGVIRYAGTLRREEYLKVLSAADIGVVATVAGVAAPSYPSKSMDYMACGLPILAAVEASSDFGEIVQKENIGIACLAGDVQAIALSIRRLVSNRSEMMEMGANGNKYLRSNHAVENIADLIIGGKGV